MFILDVSQGSEFAGGLCCGIANSRKGVFDVFSEYRKKTLGNIG